MVLLSDTHQQLISTSFSPFYLPQLLHRTHHVLNTHKFTTLAHLLPLAFLTPTARLALACLPSAYSPLAVSSPPPTKALLPSFFLFSRLPPRTHPGMAINYISSARKRHTARPEPRRRSTHEPSLPTSSAHPSGPSLQSTRRHRSNDPALPPGVQFSFSWARPHTQPAFLRPAQIPPPPALVQDGGGGRRKRRRKGELTGGGKLMADVTLGDVLAANLTGARAAYAADLTESRARAAYRPQRRPDAESEREHEHEHKHNQAWDVPALPARRSWDDNRGPDPRDGQRQRGAWHPWLDHGDDFADPPQPPLSPLPPRQPELEPEPVVGLGLFIPRADVVPEWVLREEPVSPPPLGNGDLDLAHDVQVPFAPYPPTAAPLTRYPPSTPTTAAPTPPRPSRPPPELARPRRPLPRTTPATSSSRPGARSQTPSSQLSAYERAQRRRRQGD